MSERSDRTAVLRDEAGGVILEATVVMPVYLLFIFVFLLLLRIVLLQMAVHDAATQLVKQTASVMYSLQVAREKVGVRVPSLPAGDSGVLTDPLARWLPTPARELISGDASVLIDASVALALQPWLRELADESVLAPDRLVLRSLQLPAAVTGAASAAAEDVRATVEYTTAARLPFTNRRWSIRVTVSERAWLPDATPAQDAPASGQFDPTLRIVSVTPEPARPGRHATIVVAARPGSTIRILVRFKSGTSEARHLDPHVIGEGGRSSWTFLVSGNTSEGVWEVEATNEQGQRVGRHFIVQKIEP